MPSETENNIFKIQLYPKGSKGQASNRQTPYSLNKHDVNEYMYTLYYGINDTIEYQVPHNFV